MAETKRKNIKVKTEIKPKNLFMRLKMFFAGVKSEFKKICWPKKDEMVKYSVATIMFIIFCAIFFYIIDIIFALIQSLF